MVGLAVRFDLGRYHATPWGTHVNDGRVEWPPSPWRILRALYAGSRTHVGLASRRAAIDAGLAALATAPAPAYQLPPVADGHTRHYFPSRLHSPSKPGETDRVLDAFHALDPNSELRVWWQVSLDEEALDALAAVAAALGFLGRSESVCSARLLVGAPEGALDAAPHTDGVIEDADEIQELLCVNGDADPLETLGTSVAELRRARFVLPAGTELVEYAVRRPREVPRVVPSTVGPTLARYRLHGGSRPGLFEAVAVAEALRAALQRRYGDLNRRASTPIFSGRNGELPRADQHLHAHYLATPDTDGRRIDHLVVWAPEGFGPGEIEALASLTKLHLRDAPEPLRVALAAIGATTELKLPGLIGPSRRWRSLTPFGLTRHPKRRGGQVIDGPVDQIRRELALRRLPAPLEVVLVPGQWAQFRRTRAFRSRLHAPSVVGVQLAFDREIDGPIALGALSHFGLGLFVPAR